MKKINLWYNALQVQEEWKKAILVVKMRLKQNEESIKQSKRKV